MTRVNGTQSSDHHHSRIDPFRTFDYHSNGHLFCLLHRSCSLPFCETNFASLVDWPLSSSLGASPASDIFIPVGEISTDNPIGRCVDRSFVSSPLLSLSEENITPNAAGTGKERGRERTSRRQRYIIFFIMPIVKGGRYQSKKT